MNQTKALSLAEVLKQARHAVRVHIAMCLRVLRGALVLQLLQARGLWLEQQYALLGGAL